MTLDWNKTKYQKVDAFVSIFLLATIAITMLAWYFDILHGNTLIVAIVPVGLAHWYKRKLEKLLKSFGGAQIEVEEKKLILLKPYQNYKAIIRFRDITSVKSTQWLSLDKIVLSLKDNKEITLINFDNQKIILDKLNSL